MPHSLPGRSPTVRRLLLGAVSVAVLFSGFFHDTWNAADPGWFDRHQRDTEALVVGRLVKSRQDGIFSAAGFNGAGAVATLRDYPRSDEHVQRQYSTYLEGGTFAEFAPYRSQHGGQGMLFSVLDRLLPLSSGASLRFFHFLTALLSAIVLTALVDWFYVEFGGWAAVSVALSMVLSQWLTVFGRNLWWSLWVFYLPMLAILYSLWSGVASSKRPRLSLGLAVFALIAFKCFMNGYEYITATVVMLLVPISYHAVRDRWSVRRTLALASTATVASGAAVAASFLLLSLQIGALKESAVEGLSYLMFRLGIRTHGGVEALPDRFSAGVDASTWSVVVTYLQGAYVDFENYVRPSGPLGEALVVAIGYWHLIVLFGVTSALLMYLSRDAPSARRRKNAALVCATWFSVLAPLSWFVVFKAHSYVHTHMNYILWQMPFTLFGFAVCGRTAASIVDRR